MSDPSIEMKFDEVDWTSREHIIGTFPRYQRETFANQRKKNVNNTVDICPFDLKAPFSANYLLRDARLLLAPGKRHCLVGDSGTGKSTLFETLAAGTVKDFPLHLHVYHCKEIELVSPEDGAVSVLQTVIKSYEYRNVLLACRAELQKRISAEPAPSASDLEKFKENLDFIGFQLTKMNSADAENKASKMLRVLGFDDVGQTKPISSLSGGLRMRVALCAAFFVQPDILLLDEPTNHLDFPSVLWLENRLRGYSKSFILICHDRHLLNSCTTSVIGLHGDKRITYYDCGFSEYEKRKAKTDKKYAEDIDKFMMRNRNVDFSSPVAREKQEKQRWLDAFNAKQVMLAGKFTFPVAKALKPEFDADGNPVPPSLINIENVRFSYDEKAGLPFIFDTPISFNVNLGTRVGVMGPNGAGKSTLLKLITNKLQPVSGTITRHKTANVAYFAQHHVAELNLKQTPIEFMVDQFPEQKNAGLLRKHLEKVGISGTLVETRMTQLSGGQRSCVIFAKITFECPHLLIMDEPTNFLDLESVDSLIQATNKYTGALLLVSHNREFLNKCAKQYLSVVPGQFLLFDDLKSCEKATYTFIQELEEGVGSGKIGASALVKSTSAGTNAAPSKTATPAKSSDGVLEIKSTPSTRGGPQAGRGAPQAGRGGQQPGRGGQAGRGGRGGPQGGQGGRGRGGQGGRGRGGQGGRGGRGRGGY